LAIGSSPHYLGMQVYERKGKDSISGGWWALPCV